MSKKLDLIDRAIYENALKKRLLNEILQQSSPRNNEPQFSDFKNTDGTFKRSEGLGPGVVVKVGPGLETDPSEGTYAVLIQSDILGGKRVWEREYQLTAGQGARGKRAQLHRKLAMKAKKAFRDAKIKMPLRYGPNQPQNALPWRDGPIHTARGKTYIEELFVCRGDPMEGADIIDLSPGRRAPATVEPDGSHRFRCYPNEESKTNVLQEDYPPETEDIEEKWTAFKTKCGGTTGGGWSKWWIKDSSIARNEGWKLHKSEGGAQAPRVDDTPGPWSDQIGKVVWGWRPQWHHRIIEVPDNNQIGDVKIRVVDFEWPGKPTRKETDNFTFHLKDISSDHKLTQHVKAQLDGDDQYEIENAPPPPQNLSEIRKIVREMLGGGPKFNINKNTSWEGWTHEADEPDVDDNVDEQNDEDGDPPSNLIGKEIGDDSRSSMGGAARLVPESQIRDMIMNEIQQMTKNPFGAMDILPPQEVSKPVIQGSVRGPANSNDAAAQFASECGIDTGSYSITCERSAGAPGGPQNWTCIANKSELGSRAFAGDEGSGLDEP